MNYYIVILILLNIWDTKKANGTTPLVKLLVRIYDWNSVQNIHVYSLHGDNCLLSVIDFGGDQRLVDFDQAGEVENITLAFFLHIRFHHNLWKIVLTESIVSPEYLRLYWRYECSPTFSKDLYWPVLGLDDFRTRIQNQIIK